MTCVLFLDTLNLVHKHLKRKTKSNYNESVIGELVSDMIKCIAGDVVILDGKVYHGVYPNIARTQSVCC